MAFTEQDFKKQKQEIAQLADELSRLNSILAKQKKALGLSAEEVVTISPSEITPDLEQAMADANERAKREGEARAAQARTASGTSSAAISCNRRGAVRV